MMSELIIWLIASASLFAFSLLARELILYITRTIRKAKRKKREADLYHVNPARRGRMTIYQTVTSKLQKLAWTVSMNRPEIEEGLKEYAQVFDIDNRSHFLNTFHLRYVVRKGRAIEWIRHAITFMRESLARSAEYYESVKAFLATRTRLLLRNIRTRIIAQIKATISFLYTQGGLSDDQQLLRALRKARRSNKKVR